MIIVIIQTSIKKNTSVAADIDRTRNLIDLKIKTLHVFIKNVS